MLLKVGWFLAKLIAFINCGRAWFYSSCFCQAQWGWPCTKRLVSSEITSGTSRSFVFLFCLTTSILHIQVDKNTSSPLLKQQWHEQAGVDTFWHDITTHSVTNTLFCTVNFIGRGQSWNLISLVLGQISSRIQLFYMEPLSTCIEIWKPQNPVACIDILS